MSWETATVLVGGFASLGIYSFLIKENSVYRFFEHLFIGIAAGLLPILSIRNFLWPNIFVPLLGFDVLEFPDGTTSASYNYFNLLYLAPICFGLLYYTIYSKKHGWMAKMVIGFTLGYAAGLSFKGFFAEMIPQLISSFKPIVVVGEQGFDLLSSFSNIVFLITLFSVLWYFFFSIKVENRLVSGMTTGGRWLMMICFGAFFGSTVMARMALLVERMQFLAVDWAQVLADVLL